MEREDFVTILNKENWDVPIDFFDSPTKNTLVILGPPQKDILTIRMLSQFIIAFKVAKRIKTIKQIVVFAPVHINAYSNGTKLSDNIDYAHYYLDFLEFFISMFPEFGTLEIVLKTDQPIPLESVEQYKKNYPLATASELITSTLLKKAIRRTNEHLTEAELIDKSYSYLISHLINYKLDNTYDENLYLLPQSERFFLNSILSITKPSAEIVADIKKKIIFEHTLISPPYYSFKNEPSINSLKHNELYKKHIFQLFGINDTQKAEIYAALGNILSALGENSHKKLAEFIRLFSKRNNAICKLI